MKRKTTLTMLFATFILTANAQEKVSQQEKVCEEPIPFIMDGHLYLPLTIDGTHRANMIFDTGASGQLLVDTVYLKEQRWILNTSMWGRLRGANGYSRVKISQKRHKVEHRKASETFPYMVLGNLRSVLGKHADGLFGSNDFERLPLEINYQQRFIRKLNTIPDSVKRNYQCLPLTFKDKDCLIKATIWFNGQAIEGLYIIDTGSGADIFFTEATTKQYNMESYKGKKRVGHGLDMGLGDGGVSTWIDAYADSMRMGSLHIPQPGISLSPIGKGAFKENIYVGNIGAGVLGCYNLVIDIPNGKLYCRQFKEYLSDGTMWGFSWINRTDIGKGWIVRSIYDGSAADKAELKLGDTIVEVNGKKVENYTWEEERALSKDSSITLLLKTEKGMRKVTIEEEEF